MANLLCCNDCHRPKAIPIVVASFLLLCFTTLSIVGIQVIGSVRHSIAVMESAVLALGPKMAALAEDQRQALIDQGEDILLPLTSDFQHVRSEMNDLMGEVKRLEGQVRLLQSMPDKVRVVVKDELDKSAPNNGELYPPLFNVK